MNIDPGAVIHAVNAVRLLPQDNNDNVDTFLIVAEGEAPSGGWENPRLIPWTYVQPPVDGIWDFTFVADMPDGISSDVLVPLQAEYLLEDVSEGFSGVRVHAATNNVVTAIR